MFKKVPIHQGLDFNFYKINQMNVLFLMPPLNIKQIYFHLTKWLFFCSYSFHWLATINRWFNRWKMLFTLSRHSSLDTPLKTTMPAHVSSCHTNLTVALLHTPVALGRSLLDASPKETLAAFACYRPEMYAWRRCLAHRARETFK